jgi:hypothetical protein
MIIKEAGCATHNGKTSAKMVAIMGNLQLYTDGNMLGSSSLQSLQFFKYTLDKMRYFTFMFNILYRSGFYAGTMKSLVTMVSLM